MRAAAGVLGTLRTGRLLRPHELIAVGVLTAVLLPGLALTAISTSAWPIPAVAAVGLLLLLAKTTFTSEARGDDRDDRDDVAVEAAAGVTQIETWLSQRHHT